MKMAERENSGLRLTEFSTADEKDTVGELTSGTPRPDAEMLERSWRSLHDFDRLQVGRLESVHDECPEPAARPNGDVRNGQDLWKFGEDFLIPELPAGSRMTLKIRSTWGDPYYVGLNGIEVFGSSGLPVSIKEIDPSWTIQMTNHKTAENLIVQITADPKDMTVIPKFADDPRLVANLIDGVYVTRDDIHLWLAPFKGETHGNFVRLKFEKPTQVAMIRIWNYNKSRIHSYRGVRHLEITLDDQLVFKGEVSKAPGTSCAQTEELSDTILFTTDDGILEKLMKNDSNLFGECSILHLLEPEAEPPEPLETTTAKRPSTGSRQAAKQLTRQKAEEASAKLASTISVEGGFTVMKGRKFVLELRQNWGALDTIGLSGFHLLDRHGRPCLLVAQMLSCNQKKCEPLSRLINDRNLSTNESDMWLCKFDRSTPVRVTIRFPHVVAVLGLRIWNYNRSFELSYAGTQMLNFYVEDELALSNVTLVKAPGNLHYNFCQDVLFGPARSVANGCETDCENEFGITGFVFQLQLLSTWGDEFYMGLNGIELFDGRKAPIKLQMRNIAAFPESVNVLTDVNDDVRTSDKLIDGVNQSDQIKHMWLTPVLPNTLNRIYIVFDKPTAVSSIVLWNYAKTPTRGVRHAVILVDDVIVQSSELAQSDDGKAASTAVTLLG